jgi:GntR family transcriptional regulator
LEILVSQKSSIPIYEQIISQIKELILDGELKPGDMLTSVRVLAKELGIAVLTVQKAYDRLQKEGIIESVVGKGSYVSKDQVGKIETQRHITLENKVIELAKKYEVLIYSYNSNSYF